MFARPSVAVTQKKSNKTFIYCLEYCLKYSFFERIFLKYCFVIFLVFFGFKQYFQIFFKIHRSCFSFTTNILTHCRCHCKHIKGCILRVTQECFYLTGGYFCDFSMCAKVFFMGHWPSWFLWNKLFFAVPLAKSLCGERMAQRYIGCYLHLQSVCSRLLPWSTTVAGLVCLNTSPHTWHQKRHGLPGWLARIVSVIFLAPLPPDQRAGTQLKLRRKRKKKSQSQKISEPWTFNVWLILPTSLTTMVAKGLVLGEAMGQVGVAGVYAWAGPRSWSCLAQNSAVSAKRWKNSSLRHVLPTALAGTAPMISWCLHQLATVCLREMGRGNGKAGPQKQFSEQPLPMKIWQCGTQLSKLMAVAHHMPLIADCFCPSWSSRGSRLGLPGSWSKPSMTPTKERCSSHWQTWFLTKPSWSWICMSMAKGLGRCLPPMPKWLSESMARHMTLISSGCQWPFPTSKPAQCGRLCAQVMVASGLVCRLWKRNWEQSL